MMNREQGDLMNGRGSQINLRNPFLKQQYVEEHIEGLDQRMTVKPQTQFFFETPKNLVSVSNSPDLGLMHSINPYQGCEHGCAYCYARNSHNYWGFSSGLDFESKIIIKQEAPLLLDRYLKNFKGDVVPIFLSGNTDCYQPAEKKFQLTRQLLKIFYRYRYPISIITKNALICRDLDLLEKLAAKQLVQVYLSITTLDESVRSKMEPRTATARKRLETIKILTAAGVPCGVMNAPVIPGLNDHEMPEILKVASSQGAVKAGYALVRLNGTIAALFKDWVLKFFPDKASKILNQIAASHDGKLNDSQWFRRQTGSGQMAGVIAQVFQASKQRYFGAKIMPAHDTTKFRRHGNLSMF